MAAKLEFSDSIPIAPINRTNIKWQYDANGNISAHVQTPIEVLHSKIYNVNLSNATSTIQTLGSYTVAPNLTDVGDVLRVKVYAYKNGTTNAYRPSVNYDGTVVAAEFSQGATDRGTLLSLDLIMLSATQIYAFTRIDRMAAAVANNLPILITKAPLAGGVLAFNFNWNAAGSVDTLTFVSATVELIKARV